MIMKKVVRKGHFLGFAVGMVLTVAGAAGTVCADDGIAINDANFPDPVFRAYVSTEFDTETEGKGSLSAAEISNATNLDIPSGVSSLVGIKYFSSMRSLDCSYNNLTSLDVSNCESLTSLLCNNNQLTQINVSGCNALGGFDCARNRLRTLDISSCTALTIFGCSNNQLTSLDVSHNTSLRRMECSENNLTSLDVTRNTALESLEAYSNPITLLDISSCPLLESLYFSCKEHMQSSTSQVYYTPEYWLSFDNTVTVITSKGTYPPGASSGQTEPVVAPVQTEKNTITKIPKVTGVKAVKGRKIAVNWKKFALKKKTKAIWKKIKKIEIQYSTDKSFKTGTKRKTVKRTKTSAVIKGLKKKTVYYVRIRYVGSNGEYSNWRKIKKIRVKAK